MNKIKYALIAVVCILQISCNEYKSVPIGQHFWAFNSFSPNNSGLNETFRLIPIYGIDFQKFHLTVFDQNLQTVFTSDDINQSWDGTSKGVEVPQGTYEYQVLYTASEDSINYESYITKSSILLIREN